MRKYGIENFHIELLEETDNPEERETYWIEQKQSFKNGYNATMGGDGRRYIDYDLVIATYQQLHSLKDTADTLNIHVDSVHNILTEKKDTIKALTKQKIIEVTDNRIKLFPQHFGVCSAVILELLP